MMSIKERLQKIKFNKSKEKKPVNKGDMVAIYHTMYKNEGLKKTAEIIFGLLRKAQKEKPNKPRAIILVIEGHRLKNKAFDKEAWGTIKWLISDMNKYFTTLITPFHEMENLKPQVNDIPKELGNVEEWLWRED